MSGFLVGSPLIDPAVKRHNGGTSSLTLDNAGTTNSTLLFISGVAQTAGTDFTVAGTTLSTTTAIPAGTNIATTVQMAVTGTVNVALDNSITTAKIVADAVTSAKIADDAIDSEHYTDGSIDLVHMSADSIDSTQYVDASIDAAHLSATLTPIGQHTIWVPAGAMEVAVSTAPAASKAVEIGTSLFAARTMDFATGADDFCYFGIQMPKSWDAGVLVCQFVWSATGTTANTVLWGIAATSLGNDEVLTTAFPTPTSPAADTNSTTADDLMISAEVSVTVGSTPTAEDYVIFEVSRDVSGDTLSEDARLHGIKIHYTIDAGSDT